jgi:hypothetical protein
VMVKINEVMTCSIWNIGLVTFLLAAALYQGKINRKHKLKNILLTCSDLYYIYMFY